MCGSTYVLGILMGLGAVLQKKLDNEDHALRLNTEYCCTLLYCITTATTRASFLGPT